MEVRRPSVDLDRWRDDFGGFSSLLSVRTESGDLVKLRPRPIPALFEGQRTGRDIVLKPRQVGMTIWELARDVWFFLTRPGAHVVVVCQSMADDGAIKEISDKLSVLFASLSAELGLTVRANSSTHATQWFLPSRGAKLRIVGAGASESSAKKKGRSGTIHRLHVTELAFFEYGRETLTAMLACVPAPEHGTEIVIESTPNGAAGPFYERYQAAKAGLGAYKAHFFPWFRHAIYKTPLAPGERLEPETPRERELVEKYGGTPEQLKWYRAKVAENGQDLTDQEFPLDEETCWLTSGRLFFDKERTQALLAATVAPLETRPVGKDGSHGVLRIWKRPERGRIYVISADPAEGVGGDFSAAVIYDRATAEHVATIHGQLAPWEFARVLALVGHQYNDALIVVERTNHGHAVLQALERVRHYEPLFRDRDERLGWKPTEVSRSAALDALLDAHREREWSSPDRDSLAEMLRFIVTERGRAEAAPGAHDDLVIAHAIMWDVLSTPLVDRSRHEVYDYEETE